MDELEMRHRRIERMKPYLGEGSLFYKVLKMIENGMTDTEIAYAVALIQGKKDKRVIEDDTMRVLRSLMDGKISRGVEGCRNIHHEGWNDKSYGRKTKAFAMYDKGATVYDVERMLHIGKWTAREYQSQWRVERAIEGGTKQ